MIILLHLLINNLYLDNVAASLVKYSASLSNNQNVAASLVKYSARLSNNQEIAGSIPGTSAILKEA